VYAGDLGTDYFVAGACPRVKEDESLCGNVTPVRAWGGNSHDAKQGYEGTGEHMGMRKR